MKETVTYSLTETDVKLAIAEYIANRSGCHFPGEDQIKFVTSPNRFLADVTVVMED